jgi:peroxiredoxin
MLLLISSSAVGQSGNIPAFKFSRGNQSEVFTDKNIPANKKSLFVFFDITCPHCQEAITLFNGQNKELENSSVYLITMDDKTSALSFLSKYAEDLYRKKNVTVLFDTDNEFIKNFKPVKYPSMFLYSKTKKLMIYSDEVSDVSKILELIKKE